MALPGVVELDIEDFGVGGVCREGEFQIAILMMTCVGVDVAVVSLIIKPVGVIRLKYKELVLYGIDIAFALVDGRADGVFVPGVVAATEDNGERMLHTRLESGNLEIASSSSPGRQIQVCQIRICHHIKVFIDFETKAEFRVKLHGKAVINLSGCDSYDHQGAVAQII